MPLKMPRCLFDILGAPLRRLLTTGPAGFHVLTGRGQQVTSNLPYDIDQRFNRMTESILLSQNMCGVSMVGFTIRAASDEHITTPRKLRRLGVLAA